MTKWISVKERLPEIGKLVLVCFDDKEICIGSLIEIENHGISFQCGGVEGSNRFGYSN